MTIRSLAALIRIAYPLGMVVGFALIWPALWLSYSALKLPKPGDESAVNVISAVAFIAWFFFSVYACGRLFVRLLQYRVLARCPSCGADAVGLVFLNRQGGEFRCRACPYIEPGGREKPPPLAPKPRRKK